MPSPTRIYLKTPSKKFRRLFWLQNNKPNEMLLGFYSLSGKPAIMRYMWPEYLLAESELANVTYKYEKAIKVNRLIDHITCHADGRFHIKTKNKEELYIQAMQRTEALGPDTSIFLEIIVISDLAENYTVLDGNVKYPYVWFDVLPDQYIALRGMFAGVNYNVERVMIDTMLGFPGNHGGVVVTSGTIKGVLMGHPKSLPNSARSARPGGTLLSFKFPVAEGKWHIKTFLFE
jgi:hypothetical protein